MVKGLMWFRSDLRIDDNPALLDAANSCDELISIYIFSQKQWNLHHESNVKQDFLIQNLITLEKQLKKLIDGEKYKKNTIRRIILLLNLLKKILNGWDLIGMVKLNLALVTLIYFINLQ